MLALWKKSYNKPKQHIIKERHHFADKGPSSQSYGFSNSYVQMWELDHKEGWVSKNWCFQTVVLEKILEGPLDSREHKPDNPTGNQPWIFTGTTDAEAPTLWPPDMKNQLIGKNLDAGKDWGQEEKGLTEDEMVEWHEFKQTLGDSEGQGTGMLQSMGSQRVGHNLLTQKQQHVGSIPLFCRKD